MYHYWLRSSVYAMMFLSLIYVLLINHDNAYTPHFLKVWSRYFYKIYNFLYHLRVFVCNCLMYRLFLCFMADFKFHLTMAIWPYICFSKIDNKAALTRAMAISQYITWWRHLMETLSGLLDFCAGNSPVTGEFPAQRPVTRSFDFFFIRALNKRLSVVRLRKLVHLYYQWKCRVCVMRKSRD